jgi:putative hydrolase
MVPPTAPDTVDTSTPGSDMSANDDSPAWEELLRQILGPAADDAIAQVRDSGIDLERLAAGLPTDPADLQAAVAQIQRMMAGGDGRPVNWPMAHDLARQVAASEGDPTPSTPAARGAVDALSVADLWLDSATELGPAPGPRVAWSRAEWVEATLPTWRSLTEPIAASMTDALASLAKDGMDLPVGMLGDQALVRQLGSAMFGVQMGHAVGTLAREVFGTTDIGVPLLQHPTVALVATNVERFAVDLDAPSDEVRLFLAVREAAAARLFAGVAWLRGWLTSAVDDYARGITIDPEHLEEVVRDLDLSDPHAMTQALSGGVFLPRNTPEQEQALARLETALALVEGWVDEVTAAAVAPHLPHAVPLREMLRRRRASGGPAEHTFAALVGLELRPRRVRDAAKLWAVIAADGGVEARDAVWRHPDLMPDAADLDDPDGYLARQAAEQDESGDLDQVLADILDEEPPSA